MKINNRLNSIENYYFSNLDLIKNELIKREKKIVDLSIGDPDLPVHEGIIEALKEAMSYKNFNKYPPYEGIKELKVSIIKYYEEVYSVKLNLDEVAILIGSKEGINNIIPAVCDIGDNVIIPNPSYPVYSSSCKLWGCNPYKVNLDKKYYLPKLEDIPEKIKNTSKLFIINYPNNPTGAVANENFYKDIIYYCTKHDILLCNDGAYNEIIHSNHKPLSLLYFDSEKQCVEFGSFSKTFNMTGFRIGFAVGNRKAIEALLKIKNNTDSGQFKPIQWAAIRALELSRTYIEKNREIYYKRKKLVEGCLEKIGVDYYKGMGTFYIWCNIPNSCDAKEFCFEAVEKYGILFTPGFIFGNTSYKNFRISLTEEGSIMVNAIKNMECFKK